MRTTNLTDSLFNSSLAMPKLKNRQSRIPEVNLVPMLDVLMTVLTFFILISMTLTGQAAFNVTLPRIDQGIKEPQSASMLVVSLDAQGDIRVGTDKVSLEDMAKAMTNFLNTNPNGLIVLKADTKLNYDRVSALLEIMRDVGGDSVSLAVDKKS